MTTTAATPTQIPNSDYEGAVLAAQAQAGMTPTPLPRMTTNSTQPTSVKLSDGRTIGLGTPGLGQGGLTGGQWEGGVLVPGTGIYNGSGGQSSGGSGSGGSTDDAQKNATADANAQALISTMLDGYGLGSLASWAWGLVQDGYDANYVMAQLRDRPEFKQRFPAMDIRKQNGLTPLSPAEYVQLESQYDSVIHQTGMNGMFDRNDLYTKWIGGDVSQSEVHDRAQAAYQAAMGEPVDTRAELVRLYGNDAAGVATAYFLDPTNALPKIQERLRSGEIAGGSVRSGFGLLTRQEAESLADLGITGDQAQAGFGDLTQKRELFGALPGEQASDIGRQQQIGAEFGSDANAQEAVTRRATLRRSQVNSGGTYGVGSGGVTGLGSAAS